MSKITPENVKIKDWILIGIKEAVVCNPSYTEAFTSQANEGERNRRIYYL